MPNRRWIPVDSKTWALPVPGGMIVKSCESNEFNEKGAISIAMVFVPLQATESPSDVLDDIVRSWAGDGPGHHGG
jgi:hypothetical protein